MMKKVLPCFALSCVTGVSLLAFSFPAFAADIDLETRIDQVVVYPDGANITRQGAIDVPMGASTLLIKGLPASLDPASIRVEGKGSASFMIGAVDVKLVAGDTKPVIDAELEATLKGLKDQREKLLVQIQSAETKKATIERYAQSKPENLGTDTKPFDPAQWTQAWDQLGNALLKVNDELRAFKNNVRDLDLDIQAKERARPRPVNVGAPKRNVMIALESAAPTKGTLSVTYRVSGASWQPLYDARLNTTAQSPQSKPTLDITRRASIVQQTGEDWSDVSLSVSTARASRGTAAPDLPALQAGYWEAVPMAQRSTLGKVSGEMRREASQFDQVANMAVPAPVAAPAPLQEDKRADEQFATLEAGAYQASFNVAGKVSLAQDGSAKTFGLAKRTYTPDLVVKTVPVLDETAYLEAQFTNEEEATLLAGDVLLHRDGNYIGKGRLSAIAAGDKVELGFGATDQVKVQRSPLKRRETDPAFLSSTKTDTRDFKTVVKNLHPFPIKVMVQDRIPFSEVSTLNVELLPQSTPVTEKNSDAKRGVLTWVYEMAPQQSQDIRLTYRLKWPADRELIFTPQIK
jgi:uncharacterized protein (TIGR02231 family)